jgi:hypothetical protein
MRLLFRAKWDQIFGCLEDMAKEPDNYNELLTKAESDYNIFYQYYLSQGHIITECATILKQWQFSVYQLREYYNKKKEYNNLRDYLIQNEILKESRKLISNSTRINNFIFYWVIDEGTKKIESLFVKLDKYKSRIKEGLTNSDSQEILELAGDIYNKATKSERERLVNIIDLMDKGL